MAILAECPTCHRKQATRNKVCKCGENMDRAKKSRRVRYWIQYRLDGGRQKKEYVGKSIEKARTADAARRTQKRENKLEDMLDILAEGRKTFAQLGEWYLELERVRYEAQGKKSLRRKRDCIKNFNAVFGDRIVKAIALQDLEAYRLMRLQAGISRRTMDYEMGEAKRMVNLAFDSNMVSGKTVRVFKRVGKLTEPGGNVRKRVLELEAYVRLREHLPPHVRPLFDLALYTGMRPGELIPVNRANKQEGTRGLTWDRVDFKRRLIHLRAEDTKTGEARDVPVTDEILGVLQKIPRDMRSRYVFTFLGRPLSDIRGGVKNACKAAGIPYGMKRAGGFVFRDLRTTADTLMVRAGVPDVYRRTLLGHKQWGMDRHYVHPDFERDLREALAGYTSWLRQQLQDVTHSVTQAANVG